MEGARNPGTAAMLANLALLYSQQGRYTEAEPFFKQALAIDQESAASGKMDTIRLLTGYAKLLRGMKRKAEAKRLEEQVRALVAELATNNYSRFTVDVRTLAKPHPDYSLGHPQ
jgi:tetratricopeptide (TPR) repeat protein